MRRADFNYELPPELIAQIPPAERGGGRLLALRGADEAPVDLRFTELPTLLRPGDLLVFNDTRVVRARLFAHKDSGGAVELLLERVLADERRGAFQARASKPLRAGATLMLEGGGTAVVQGRIEELVDLRFEEPVLAYLERHGHVPLPPYIRRDRAAVQGAEGPQSRAGELGPDGRQNLAGEHGPDGRQSLAGGYDEAADAQRYQTVFARQDGAVAAPTAGLHFDLAMLQRLRSMQVHLAYVTLHVGAGTFQPVRVEDLDAHRMHRERVTVNAEVCAAVAAARARGGRVVAVGTTVVRSLESASLDGALAPFEGETELFIRPGYRFRAVDALITNFHLPESTLLMLVCAFGGFDRVMRAYRHAVQERYRFFSYGDAMFVTPESS